MATSSRDPRCVCAPGSLVDSPRVPPVESENVQLTGYIGEFPLVNPVEENAEAVNSSEGVKVEAVNVYAIALYKDGKFSKLCSKIRDETEAKNFLDAYARSGGECQTAVALTKRVQFAISESIEDAETVVLPQPQDDAPEAAAQLEPQPPMSDNDRRAAWHLAAHRFAKAVPEGFLEAALEIDCDYESGYFEFRDTHYTCDSLEDVPRILESLGQDFIELAATVRGEKESTKGGAA